MVIEIVEKAVSWNTGTKVRLLDDGVNSREMSCGGSIVRSISFKDLLECAPPNTDIVLKVDCEGCEYPLFYGSDINDIRRIKTLYIEIHGNRVGENCGNRKLMEIFLQYVCGYEMVHAIPLLLYDGSGEGKDVLDVWVYKFIRK